VCIIFTPVWFATTPHVIQPQKKSHKANNPMFSVTLEVAADTGIHLGDGSLLIGRGSYVGTYRYELTGNAIEDQIYLIGHAAPLIASAYGITNPTFYVNPGLTWMSVRYHNKTLVLFKHEQLGLPNGKKTYAFIPEVIRANTKLMRPLAREILATDGVLGFYNASSNHPHRYGRIQIRMTARKVIEGLGQFLRDELGMSVSCRLDKEGFGGPNARPQHILQINRSEDIELWKKEIGFSNPSHISRFMVFQKNGECPPKTSIVNRLLFLTGCSSRLDELGTIPADAMTSILNVMKRNFGSPTAEGRTIVDQIVKINCRLNTSLHRALPKIVGV